MSQAPGLSGTPDFGHCLQCRDQGVLRQFLGDSDIAHDAGHTRDDAGVLDPEDRLDCLVRPRSRHRCSSDQSRVWRGKR